MKLRGSAALIHARAIVRETSVTFQELVALVKELAIRVNENTVLTPILAESVN